jgi:hypothetical protein
VLHSLRKSFSQPTSFFTKVSTNLHMKLALLVTTVYIWLNLALQYLHICGRLSNSKVMSSLFYRTGNNPFLATLFKQKRTRLQCGDFEGRLRRNFQSHLDNHKPQTTTILHRRVIHVKETVSRVLLSLFVRSSDLIGLLLTPINSPTYDSTLCKKLLSLDSALCRIAQIRNSTRYVA